MRSKFWLLLYLRPDLGLGMRSPIHCPSHQALCRGTSPSCLQPGFLILLFANHFYYSAIIDMPCPQGMNALRTICTPPSTHLPPLPPMRRTNAHHCAIDHRSDAMLPASASRAPIASPSRSNVASRRRRERRRKPAALSRKIQTGMLRHCAPSPASPHPRERLSQHCVASHPHARPPIAPPSRAPSHVLRPAGSRVSRCR